MTRRELFQATPMFAGFSVLWRWAKPRSAHKPEYFWWYCPVELAHEYAVGSKIQVQLGDLRLPHTLATKIMHGRIVEKHEGWIFPTAPGSGAAMSLDSNKVAFKCEIIR